MSKTSNRRNSKKGYDDILPDDNELLERTKVWGSYFEKHNMNNEANSFRCLDYPDVNEEDNISENESIKVSEYEAASTNEDRDSDFDVRAVLNQTKKVIKKRKEKWYETGFDKMIDSIWFRNFNDKVDSWLQNSNNDFKNDKNSMIDDSDKNYINKFQLEGRQIIMEHNGSDSDSLQSVDTAKYILSNQKKKKKKLTTMVIKSFCYSQQRAQQKVPRVTEKLKSNLNTSDSFSDEKCSDYQRSVPKCLNSNQRLKSDSNLKSKEILQRNYGRKLKTKRRLKRSSPSSSSSSTESSFRRNKNSNNKEKLNLNRSFKSTSPSRKKCLTTNSRKKRNTTNLSIIQKDSLPIRERKSIVIYTPKKSPLFNQSIINGKLRITEEDLEKILGKELTNTYLGDNKPFVYECDPTSQIVFDLPDESVTSDSELDILETIDRTKTGRIIEIATI